uniref:Golgin subfamily A member 5 n=1 Tax=Eptatretus burgeri TaxID=7764 RepID=A0A8C4QHZ6_EPTBU
MAWLTGLAGKAEDFLNRVDQGAALALTMTSETLQSNHESAVTAAQSQADFGNFRAKTTAATTLDKGLVGPSNTFLGCHAPPAGEGGKSSSQFVRPRKAEPDDEQLFDFLNSTLPSSGNNGRVKPPSVHSSLSRTSSLGSLSVSTRGHEEVAQKEESVAAEKDVQEGLWMPVSSKLRQNVDDSSLPVSQPMVDHIEDIPAQELSSLRLENQLLRSETTSLNQEMATLVNSNKHLQDDLGVARARLEKWTSDASKSDEAVREIHGQVTDLKETLAAKDSQLAVLRVRLDEADKLLQTRDEALQAVQEDRNRILHDQEEGSSHHSHTLHSLQDQLKGAEAAFRREKDRSLEAQEEFSARLTRLESERQGLLETLANAERRASEAKNLTNQAQQKNKMSTAALDTLKQEMTDYKQKATRILQSKEKLISSLKEGIGPDGLEATTASALEIEDLRHERELQQEEIQRLLAQLQNSRSEIQEIEMQQALDLESARNQELEFQEQLVNERRLHREAEAESERCKQEYLYLEGEVDRTTGALQRRINDREEEIQKLRNQLTTKAMSGGGQAELERRLQQLTETLIQKQTALEVLSTERTSLALQLERLEQQHCHGASAGIPSVSLNVDGSEVHVRNIPVLCSEGDVFSSGVYGRVRKAASTIDRFSIRLGVFLRRYPIARVLILLYIIILHFWVMIVLLTYTPEMHVNLV